MSAPENDRFAGIGRPVVVASHRRSGTHLTIDLIRRQFPAYRSWKLPGQANNRLYLTMCMLEAGDLTEPQAFRIVRRPRQPIIKTHARIGFPRLPDRFRDWVRWIERDADICYCVRDGRDVMCSLHQFLQISDPSTRCGFTEFLHRRHLPEYLPGEVDWPGWARYWANHVRGWLDRSDALLIRYEEMTAHPRRIVEQLGRHLSKEPAFREPLLPPRLGNERIDRLGRRSRIRPQSTAIISPIGSVGIGTWREVFSRADREHFQREAGDVLIRLGYEPDDRWIEDERIDRG